MTGWKLFLSTWNFEPQIVLSCAVLWMIYIIAARFKINLKSLSYTLGILLIFLALASPIDQLGKEYLFSFHMLQHEILGFFAPPLLIAGIPVSFVKAWLHFPFIARLEKILSHPALALGLGLATLWMWHLPLLYNLSLENKIVHVLEHLTFIITGSILWWPVFKPIPEGRLSPLAAIIYITIAAFVSSILGIIFTVCDTTIYCAYANHHDHTGIMKLIRDKWGLTQLDDQKLGGAIMWEPMGAVFLCAVMVVMFRWFKQSKDDSLQDG
jgi:cytochrome c oxidase assembly factor CtaG